MKQFLSFPTYLANVFRTLKKKMNSSVKIDVNHANKKIIANSTDRFIIKAEELTRYLTMNHCIFHVQLGAIS